MRCFVGIDLCSITTKAVVIDEDRNVLGRGITNSRSNYDTAAAITKQEAPVNNEDVSEGLAAFEARRTPVFKS